MPEVWFAIPGELATLTGGYVYARRLMEALPGVGWTPRHVPLPDSYPVPSAAHLTATRDLFASLPSGATVLVDGLAFGAMPPWVMTDLPLRFVALVHHPLALETGVPPDRADYLKTSEREALALAKAVIVTSPTTAKILVSDYGVPESHIHVALPGTDAAKRATPGNARPKLLTVATVTPRKGHDVLIEALRLISDLPWDSICVGSLTRDPPMTAAVCALARRYHLDGRVRFAGELEGSELARIYGEAEVFVLPSRYEGYGMVFADALAHGLPIVACAAGAVGETVPQDAGLLVPPDDPEALAGALRSILADSARRRRMSAAAWSHGTKLPRWAATAAKVAAALAP